jgi:hypothetical protein
MPIVPITDPSTNPLLYPSAGGLTPARIKEMANRRTERRGEKTLDLDYELLDVIQDFCSRYYWYWRRLTAVLTTAPGVAVYNLADQNGANALNCEKIISAHYVRGTDDMCQLSIVTDAGEVSRIIEGESTSSGEPSRILREPGYDSVVRIAPTPNAAYRVRIMFWALPSMATDALGETVPLVPARCHRILVRGLEANIFRYAIGEGAAKYTAAKQDYESLVAKESENRHGFTGIVREYTCQESAIRSTNL